jgi:hypothetical protein
LAETATTELSEAIFVRSAVCAKAENPTDNKLQETRTAILRQIAVFILSEPVLIYRPIAAIGSAFL